MTAEFNWDEIEVSEIIEGLIAVMLVPIVLPIAAGMNQPLAKKTIKEAIAFSQRCQEALADAQERFEDILAEAKAELAEEQATVSEAKPLRPRQHNTPVLLENSEVADELLEAVREFNTELEWLTNGYVDLRLLMPLALGMIALEQLITQGPKFEEIPWYNLAWYAFDSFNKLNQPHPKEPTSKAKRPSLRGQEAEGRGQEAEGRRQKAGGRRQEVEGRGQEDEIR